MGEIKEDTGGKRKKKHKIYTQNYTSKKLKQCRNNN
jgi:hypothetical protein